MCNEHEHDTFSAFMKCKCPRCHSGKVFTHWFYNPVKFLSTNENCPVCHVKFEKETGFYWSAMYVSYGINVALCVFLGLLTNVIFNDPSVNTYLFIIFGGVVLLSPLIFRYSRIIALYSFGGHHYDPSLAKK